MFLTLVVAQLVLARAFRSDPSWRDLRAYSIVSGSLTLALLVLFIAGPIDGWNGLVQRVFLAVPLVWIMVLGTRLRRQRDSVVRQPLSRHGIGLRVGE